MHAKRESELHVPHDVGQSAAIVDGLAQISAVSLHAVFEGHVNVEPLAAPIHYPHTQIQEKKKYSIELTNLN